jgi:hypothetical protein
VGFNLHVNEAVKGRIVWLAKVAIETHGLVTGMLLTPSDFAVEYVYRVSRTQKGE